MNWKPYAIDEVIKINEMFSFFKFHYDSSFKYIGESHNFWECVYVVNGSICVSADERIYNLSEGEMIFHKPLEFHKFHITEDSGATLLVFSFSAQGRLCSYFENKVFSLSRNQLEIIRALSEYAEKFATDDNETYKMYLHAFENVEVYSQNIVNFIYSLFISLFENGNILPSYKSADAVIFERTVKYMVKNIYLNPSVEEFAKYASVSVSGLKRIFSRYTGIGIHKYFLNMKLKEAARLISSGESVTGAAEKLSFSSQGYFSLVFKREFGFSPSQSKK